MMVIKEIATKNLITKSNLPDADYVINPYGGCPHKCIYCYAEFMKRFIGHTEDWGEFLDIKHCQEFRLPKISNDSTILIGSVTDAYNPFEKKYEITRNVLSHLVHCSAKIEILTKSDLVLRDIDLIKQFSDIKVGISINTLDDSIREEIEPRASSIAKRINTLEQLTKNGITTYLFMSPIFPEITKFKEIIQSTRGYFKYVCFENLNLRGAYKPRVLNYIKEKHPYLIELYDSIYNYKDISYWENLKKEITTYCKSNNIEYRLYFYHEHLKKNR